jgi:glycosyltransferase involved in cell wall biosynthesis
MPQVSVIMRVGQGGKFLHAACASLQAQSMNDWELVFVDDGSPEGIDAARAAAAKESRAVLAGSARGLGAMMDLGCRTARSELVAVLDYDDLAHPSRLELQSAYLRAQPGLALLGSAVELIDGAGRRIGSEPLVASHEQIFARLPFVHVLRHSSLMFRRSLLDKAPYRPEFEAGEDWDFFARAAEQATVACLPATLCSYRLHGNNSTFLTNAKHATYAALVQMCTRRRRSGLPENLDEWKKRLCSCAASGSLSRTETLIAREFARAGHHDLASLHAWLSWRAGGGLPSFARYLLRSSRGVMTERSVWSPLVRAWLKEPAHQLLQSHGMPERLQF